MSSLSTSKSLTSFSFPQWGRTELICVEKATKRAWCNVAHEHSGRLSSYSEEEITTILRDEVSRIMESNIIPGFNKAKFETLVRGAKAANFNGIHIEKAPDLTLRRQSLHPGIANNYFDALFIECKLIDRGKTPLKYIEEGIKRFVIGDYAWAMPHAMMLAYVRDSKTLPDSLMISYKRNKKKSDVLMCEPIDNRCTPDSDSTPPQTHKTKHARPWKHKDYGWPGDIELFHIWFTC
ncbi:MAG: hypothetical protein L6406_08375 [Desulfobacterales bacterium]|nr:hypothetical protein [Desulfobacterales bacterium]